MGTNREKRNCKRNLFQKYPQQLRHLKKMSDHSKLHLQTYLNLSQQNKDSPHYHLTKVPAQQNKQNLQQLHLQYLDSPHPQNKLYSRSKLQKLISSKSTRTLSMTDIMLCLNKLRKQAGNLRLKFLRKK